MGKEKIALIGMILTLVFIIIAMIGPWYSMSFMGFSFEAGLFTQATAGISRGPWDTTMYIAIVALVFSIIALIGALGLLFNFGNASMMGKLGGIFGILTFILSLVAALYFMTSALGDTNQLGFWNAYGGPGYGWYMMIIAAIIALISSLMVFMTKKGSPTVAPPVQ